MNHTSLNFDPYAILQISHQATPAEVKSAYRTIARSYHPDKGGNPEMFRILTQAYETIISRIGPTPSMESIANRENPEVVQRGNLRPDNYSRDKFNQQFQQQHHRSSEVNWVYDVDDSDYQPRNMADYRRERDSVNQDLGKVQPLFTRGAGFNPSVFNQMFEQLKKQNEQTENSSLVPYNGEPQAMVSNQIGFSDLNPHAGTVSRTDIITGDLSQNYCELNNQSGHQQTAGSFNHPSTLSRKEYQRLSKQPDVTRANSPLSKRDMKQRLSEYQSSKHVIPKGGPAPPSGDLNYDFDPYYRQRTPNLNQARLEHHQQQSNQRRQPKLRPITEKRSTPKQIEYYQPPQQVVSYLDNDESDLGKPMTPQIYYQPPPPPQSSTNNQNQRAGKQYHSRAQVRPPAHRPQQQLRPINSNHQSTRHQNRNHLDRNINYQPSNNLMPYPQSSNSGERQLAENRTPRSQFTDAESQKMQEMEAELNKLRRKTKIQDKLIRRIKKNGNSSRNE